MYHRSRLAAVCAMGVVITAGGLLAHRAALSQIARRNAGGAAYKSEVTIEIRDGYRYITSNGIPDHPTGRFPNAGNPNSISPQHYSWRVPVAPKLAAATTVSKVFGVAVNGVPFDPGTAELWNNDFQWHYEALTGFLATRGSLGADENLAHVQPNGAYHYHGLPFGLLKRLDYTHKPALVGYAADGFPIYGNYGYSNMNDTASPIKVLKSSYRIRSGERPGGANGPGGAYDGSFAQDYEYVKGLGDLDASNGRTGITPEYPNGTYYYVLTDTWPFVPRQFRGTPDASFRMMGPGGAGGPGQGPGGPGGQGPGNFGRPGQGPGGFGGPGGQGGPPGLPHGFVPADALRTYLSLSKEQNQKLDNYVKVMDAIRATRFGIPAIGGLKLTDSQIDSIAGGAKIESVLTPEQTKFFNANQRPAFPGGGPPGGGPGFGPPGGPPPEAP